MAALLLKENVEFHTDLLPQIYHHCEENLPVYARPLFLRFIKVMPLTTTHKQKKVDYVKEGFDPARISDPLFRISYETKTFVPLTIENVGQFLAKSRLWKCKLWILWNAQFKLFHLLFRFDLVIGLCM